MSSVVEKEASGIHEAVAAVIGPDTRVTREPWKLAGGTMHDMWGVDVAATSGPLELVVRTSPRVRNDLTVARREFATISESRKRGVIAPPVYGVGANSEGEPYLVLGRVEGDASPRPLLRDPAFAEARGRILQQLADSLAKIHTINPGDLDAPFDVPPPGEDPLLSTLRGLAFKYDEDRVQRYPVIEWAFRWVRHQAERMGGAPAGTVLVHGDYRVGNVMYDQNGLAAVLDWEGSHAGDPLEDLAWFCVRVWRFGQNHLEAGGIAGREEWVQAYERASGRAVDRGRLALWEILCNVRWEIIILNQVKTHLANIVRSQELAAIGRRTGETELEVLRLVQHFKEAQ